MIYEKDKGQSQTELYGFYQLMIKQLTVDACSAAVADLADHAQLIR